MGEKTPADDQFGARFLAAFRGLGGNPSVWTYATLKAFEVAGREDGDLTQGGHP